MNQILVLGGGASGIAAAVAAAEKAGRETKVILLEQNPRIGKKLLATGNGRCNLDNRNASPAHYVSADQKRFEQLFKTAGNPLGWFERHGLFTRTDEQGRVYPYSNQAADFLNLLLYWLEEKQVEIHTGCTVKAISRRGREYQVITQEGEKFFGQAVICAMGGKAGPQFGTDGFSGRLAEDCGLQVEEEYPCLVPLRCNKSEIQGLSGIRVKARACLYEGDWLAAEEDGEIQFTDQGLSGIAIMQLSNRMRKKRTSYTIHLNLFPQMSTEEITALMESRLRLFAAKPLSELMTGLVNRKIGCAVCKAANLDINKRCGSLNPAERQALSKGFADWKFGKLSPLEWKQAQTTGGGISLFQIEPESFMLEGCPGLYFVGEALDCAGDCGGFNLHFAFGSGIAAGSHAAGFCRENRSRSSRSGKNNRR